jgi:hypothetical protein
VQDLAAHKLDELAGAMSKVIDEPHAVMPLAQRGQQRIHAYRRDRILRMHEDLYEEALRG